MNRHWQPPVIIPRSWPLLRSLFNIAVPRALSTSPTPTSAPVSKRVIVPLADIHRVCWVCGKVNDGVRERRYFYFMRDARDPYHLFDGRACEPCVKERKVPYR